jgi:hypothetical protein
MNPVNGIYPQTDSVIHSLVPLANPEADRYIDRRMDAG